MRKLAVGGMAEIFLAQLEAAHGFTKQVVIKRLLPHLCEDRNFVDMFLSEARLTAGLSHPNLAQVFDIGESDGRLHYVMEYVYGQDLRDIAMRIDDRCAVPPLDLVIGVCISIAAGLHYAHTARDQAGRALAIIHRDVTPSNVVVTYSGVAKLLDFGVAKAKLEGRESTAAGVLKGKLPYMSPEQISCSMALDGRSDVFSLGVMLWELTTKHRLYRCPSPLETVRRITSEDAPPPSSVCEDYPPALEVIVLRALARDREHRYASALELQRALEVFALDHQLVTSSSRIAELMAELFAKELEDERTRLESKPPPEVTVIDSEVYTSPVAKPGPDEDDASTVISVVQPGLGPAPLVVRRWPWIAGSLAGALAIGLAWKVFGTAPPVEPPTPASDSLVAQPQPVDEPVQEPEPASGGTTTSAGLVDPEPVAEIPVEDAPDKPSKRERKSSRPKPSTTPQTEWNKNSLALPE